MDRETALKILNNELALRYHKTVNDVLITDAKGYWQDREPCDISVCHHPLHGCLGCGDPVQHTYYFAEHGLRDTVGKFVSPFRVWNALNESADGARSI